MPEDVSSSVAAIARIEAVPIILDLVCQTTGMGFAAVARVTEDRWIACSVEDRIAFGLEPGGELKVETTICHEVRQLRDVVVIDSVADDEIYCRHHTPAIYGFQSYISMPIVLPDGRFFGTLCAIDPNPRRLNTPEVLGMFRLFSDLIGFHLDALERVTGTEAALAGEREIATFREQFIAVLGHDLRNPLAAVSSGARLLMEEKLSPRGMNVLKLMQSSAARMASLIDNVLDLAQGRLGGGLRLTRSTAESLEPLLDQVVAELRASHSERRIDTEFELSAPVACDPARISQLFSNLLGNALTYGAPDEPVRAQATIRGDIFQLWVANSGDPIPPDVMERLFAPFSRGEVRPGHKGLGLGLYISSEIARAHGGTLTASSSPEETRFTFEMPLR